MTTDDLKQHGITAGVAAAVAIATSLAVRPSAPAATAQPEAATAAAPGQPRALPPPDPCKAHDGVYADEASIPSEGCKLRKVRERPIALQGCGDNRSGVVVVSTPRERLVVSCELAKEM